MSGIVALLDPDGNTLKSTQYDCPSHRRRTIEAWSKWYGPGYLKCSIQISPRVNVAKINAEGTNKRLERVKKYRAKVYKGIEIYSLRA